MSISWRFLIDWDNDGDWNEAYEDITEHVMQANWSLGMQRPFQLTADETELTLLLDNRDRRFSPEYSGSPYYGEMLPQRKIKIEAIRNATTTVLYMGWLESIAPQAGLYSAKSATIRGVGAKQFFETSTAQIPIMENARSDKVIDALLKKVVAPPATGNYWAIGIEGHGEIGQNTYMANTNVSYLLNTGQTTFGYVGDTWGDNTDVYAAIGDVVEAERGKFYFDRDGAAVFWDRHRLTTYTGISSLTSYAASNLDKAYQIKGQSGSGGTLNIDATGSIQGIGDAGGTEFRRAQPFMPSTSGNLSEIKFTLSANSGTPTGGISWEVRADASGLPGALLSSGGAVAVTASAENTITVSGGAFLDATTKYWLVLYTQDQATSNRYNWQTVDPATYTGYEMAASSNGGVTWTVGTHNGEFEITTSAASARDKLAQSVQVAADGQVGSVRLRLKKTGTPTGNLTLKIQTNSGGNPSGTTITGGTSATVVANELSGSYADIEFMFANAPTLSANTTYWLVLETSDSANNLNYVEWGADGSSPGYASGEMKSQTGGTWSAVSADAIFDVRSTSSELLYNGADFVQMNYEYGSYLATIVTVNAYPRKVDNGGGQIWSIEEPVDVRAQDTKEIRAKFSDPNNEDAKIAAQGVSIGTITVSRPGVTAVVAAESNSAVITLTNTRFSERRITALTLNAEKLITSYNQIEMEAIGSAQVGLYGQMIHKIDGKLIEDDEYARQIAYYELNRRKEPFGAFVSVEMMPKNARCETEMLTRTIGDRIRISEHQTAQSNQDYFIVGESWDWVPGEIRSVWYLEPADKNAYWLIGVPGFSEVQTSSRVGL